MRRPPRFPKRLHWPTDEEEAAINRGIALDPDSPELTDEDWTQMRPSIEVVPEIVKAYREGKLRISKKMGRPTIGDEPKVHIGFRLSADLVANIRASGPGYNVRVEKALRRAFMPRALPAPRRGQSAPRSARG